MASGYLFGPCKVVQIRSGFSDLDGKAEQRAGMKALKRKVLPSLILYPFPLSGALYWEWQNAKEVQITDL